MKDSKMMSQLYSHCQIWYNYCSAETNRLSGLFLLPNSFNTIILVNLAAASKGPRLFVSAPTDKAKRGCGFYFVQSNRKEKAQVLVSPEPWKGLTYMSVKTANMIAHLTAAVKKVSQHFPTIPNLESPGNYLASDSILSFLVRLEVPGLASLFPPMAAPAIDALLPGAASSLGMYDVRSLERISTKTKSPVSRRAS